MRPGGQEGHKGRTLAWRSAPDTVIEHFPAMCAACGLRLDSNDGSDDGGVHSSVHARVLDRAQSYDLPPVVLTVTEHRRMAVTCAHCGHESAVELPRFGGQVTTWESSRLL